MQAGLPVDKRGDGERESTMGLILKPQMRRDRGARKAWDGLLNALRGKGWQVVEHRRATSWWPVAYDTGARRGTLFMYDRSDGIWRVEVDVRVWTRRSVQVPVKRPATYQGTTSAHEITFMRSEIGAICEWLLRWIVAYDAGQPLPDMPDGTPYDGGYQWTKARQAVTRG